MTEILLDRIKLGISSCLLGERVRFDAGHKRNTYVTGVLQKYFEFVPYCPEVAIGLGVPREPIRLVSVGGQTRCRGGGDNGLDHTDALLEAADVQRHTHEQLCGYILKRDSPSCGMERVKVYAQSVPSRTGVGVFARRLIENFPQMPVEEEGRLQDAQLRENFIQRVYVYSRWTSMLRSGLSLSSLQSFHARHKYLLMSHSQSGAKALGVMLGGERNDEPQVLAAAYSERMFEILKCLATRRNHVNTLQHIQGYLKRHLDADAKAELNEILVGYKAGLLPLVVPITLLRHHFRRHPNPYITQSYYMDPHPGELMLLNNI